MRGSRHIVGGIILLTLGLLLGIGWYYAHTPVMNTITDDLLKDNLVVDSPNSKGYNDWVEGDAQKNPNYHVYYMWNITNPEEVLNGQKAQYESVGPYYYRYYWSNRNASFLDGGNIVQFNLIEDYIFMPNMSSGDPTTDKITIVNPAYVGVIQQTGGEFQLLIVGSLPIIRSFLDFFTGDYLQLLSSTYVPTSLGAVTQSIISYIAAQQNTSATAAQSYFYTQWANATTAPPVMANWSNMIISTNDQSTNIPMASVVLLFDPKVNLSLLSNNTASIITWLRADNDKTGPEANYLCTTFGLTNQQLNTILAWRNATFIQSYVKPSIIAEAREVFPSANWTDVGWVQYVAATFTDGQSFSDWYSEWYPQYPTSFELAPNGVTLTVPEAKTLLIGPYGLLNVENFPLFDNEENNGDKANFSKWGISSDQAGQFFGYLAYLATSYTNDTIVKLIEEGSGLLLTKTADYLMWRCKDPIIEFLLGADLAYCGLQQNDSVQAPSQIWTGKDSLSKLGTYISWRNQTTVNYWNGTVAVNGSTDGGQFPPNIQPNQDVLVWDESFIKTLILNQFNTTQVKDIDVYTFKLNEIAFAVSELYTNTIEGFANETAANQGVPIFLSNWDLYGVDPKYANVNNMHPNESDVTTLFVEPITGNTLQANMKLQVNIYLPPGFNASLPVYNYGNVLPDTFYPLIKIWQKSLVGDQDAQKLRDILFYESRPFNVGILWGIIGLGAALFLVGTAVLARGVHLRRRRGYEPIIQ